MGEADVLRDARARSRESRTSTWSLVYGGFLLTLTGCAMGLAVVHEAVGTLGGAGASWVPCALAAAWAAGLLATCLSFGPAHARPAPAMWLLPSPIDRARLLRRPLLVTFGLVATLGALGGLTTALLGGGGSGAVVLVPLGGLVGVAVHQIALWAQARRVADRLRVAAAVVAAAAALVITWGRHVGATWEVTGARPWIIGVTTVLVAAVTLVSTWRWATWLRQVGRPSLRTAGDAVDTAVTGAVMLDPSVFAVRSARRAGRRRGRATSFGVAHFRHRFVVVDFLARDVVAAFRRRGPLAARAAWMLGVWAFGAIFGPAFSERSTVVVAAFVVWSVVAMAGQGLTTWLGSSSLWRLVPTRPQAVTLALTLTPLVLGAFLGAVMLGGAGVGAADALAWGGLLAVSTVAGVARRADPPPVTFGNSVSTPLGDVEIGLAAALLHGPDVVALCLLAGMLAGPQLGCFAALGWFARVVLTARPGGRRR